MQSLIDACIQDDDKLYLCVSSPTIKDKPVQIRPWRLSDADFVLDASFPLDSFSLLLKLVPRSVLTTIIAGKY